MKKLITFLLLGLCSSGYTQMSEDSVDIIIDRDISNRYTAALKYTKERIQKAASESNYIEEATWRMKAAAICIGIPDLSEAQKHIDEGIELCEMHNLDLQRAELLYQQSRLFHEKKDIAPAFEILLKNVIYLEKNHPNSQQLSNHLIQVAYYYNILGNYGESEKKLLAALKIEKKLNPKGVSAIYNNLGILANKQGELSRSLTYFRQTIIEDEKFGQSFNHARTYNNIGSAYIRINQPDSALANLRRGMKYADEEILKYSGLYENLAESYLRLGELDSALHYTRLAQDNVRKGYMSLDKEAETHRTASALFEKMNMPDSALHYAKLLYAVSDKLWYSEEKEKIIGEVELQAKIKYQEEAIQALEEKNYYQQLTLSQRTVIIIICLILLGLVVLIGGMIFYQRNLRQARTRTEMEQMALINQLNPHFIFNAFTAIQAFVLQNKPREATSYMNKFAELMRQILDQTRAKKVSIREEIETLSNYLDLQQLRLSNSFSYEFDVDPQLDEDECEIPSLIVQPLIENAVEHGIRSLQDRPGKISVSFKKDENNLIIKIQDNGIGREAASQLPKSTVKKKGSYAMEILAERMEGLFGKRRFTLQVSDVMNTNQTAEGTSVLLTIPIHF